MTLSMTSKPQRPLPARLIAALLLVLGTAVCVGAAFAIPALHRILPGEQPIESSTGVQLLLGALSILLLSSRSRRWQIAGRVVALIMLCCAGTELIEDCSDQFFDNDLHWSLVGAARGLSFPGPMAPLAGVVFLVAGLALLLCDVCIGGWYLSEVVAAVALTVSMVALIGNSCGANKLCTLAGCIRTGFVDSVAYVMLAAGVLFLRSDRGGMAFVLADSIAGIMMRRVAAVLVMAPGLLWLRALGVSHGLIDEPMGWALFTVVFIVFVGIAFAMTAKVVQKMDMKLMASSRQISLLSEQISSVEQNREKRMKHVCLACGEDYPLEIVTCPKCGGSLARITKRHYLGEVFAGRYELLQFLGEGGMSSVYRAENTTVRKPVAIKVIHARHASDAAGVRRLQQEAQAAGSLSHPNLVSVYDFGITEEGEAFLVMELLSGRSLGEVLTASKQLQWEQVVAIFVDLCKGLDYAHKKGIVHRDLKPSNIMLSKEQGTVQVKIVDFGIARDLNVAESQRLTGTGELIGSPPYMSPEQCSGAPLDARSDVYSLGCMMYECLTGKPPFVASNVIALIQMHLDATPERLPADLGVPDWLEQAVLKCLEKNPDERFQSVKELFERLIAKAVTKAHKMPSL